MTVISSSFTMKMRPFSKSHRNLELGGFSTGYVIATSEPADSQVSPFSPSRTTFELVDIYKRQVSSFSPSRTTFKLVDIYKRQVSVRQGLLSSLLTFTKDKYSPFSPTRANLKLGGFSTGYVIATSEPADNQVSSFSTVRTIFSNGCNTT